jgi:hypothetical protein
MMSLLSVVFLVKFVPAFQTKLVYEPVVVRGLMIDVLIIAGPTLSMTVSIWSDVKAENKVPSGENMAVSEPVFRAT